MSDHGIVLGQTGSGKSTLARRLARAAAREGRCVLVLDPCVSAPDAKPWPVPRDMLMVTDDVAAFLAAAAASTDCLVVADECGTALDRHDAKHAELLTQSRHRGHTVLVVTQYWKQLPPVMREQCATLFLFRVGRTTARVLADEWADDALAEAYALPRFAYLVKRACGPPARRGSVTA